MSRGRRAVLLAGLAVLLGALAASHVAARESALQARIGRPVAVLVTARDVRRGATLDAASLAVRRLPARYVPALSFGAPAEVEGRRAAVPIPRGSTLQEALLQSGAVPAPAAPVLRPGERVAELLARGDPQTVRPGGHVDVLVTSDHGDSGTTRLALEDAEVLSSAPAQGDAHSDEDDSGPHVRVGLRVTIRQAVALAAAQDFARAIRVLPRGPDDRRRGLQGLQAAG